ncbi:tripartite motif-containing protein 16-like isoform X2 [Triplophysa rosa]|uniref:FinTRIM family n=2 Tax=Triplophysa rosa TaxID=992332 RepID=A0A9W7WMD6_TRIRA|nr:tripartite motif-containing protein 16-like isoform X2 [Triplophysa rosa]KAI7804138.1 putative finTRIM family [Triplophysa rosa]
MRCITDCWDHEDQTGIYRCPQCRQTFSPRPVLGKNVMVAEMMEKLKTARIQVTSDVECDVCTERKHKAVKSCLLCLNSYCQTHLEQHENLFRGRRHSLIDPTGRLQEMNCSQHHKMMEIYCNRCQRCICVLCLMHEHRDHDTASISAANTEKQSQLGETQNKLQQKIQEKERDLQKLRDTVTSHKRCAQTAVEDCEMTFTELMSEVTQLIRDQETAAVSRAEGRVERLKQEIEDLKRRNTELEKLSQTQDHIQFLQSFQCLSVSGSAENISITSDVSFDDDVVKSVSQFREKLQRFCREEIRKISVTSIQVPEPRSRREFLQYFRPFTLDPNTVNHRLTLSEGNQVATYILPALQYPDHPDRFDDWSEVMCRDGVSGRCYWEVEWTGRGRLGVDVAVAYRSMGRKGVGLECAAGRNDQSWSLFCCPNHYSFIHNNSEMIVPLDPSSSRVGVYVDHSAGLLSFYSVSNDTTSLIHRVHTTFTQPLCPMFGLDEHSAFRLAHL